MRRLRNGPKMDTDGSRSESGNGRWVLGMQVIRFGQITPAYKSIMENKRDQI